VGTGSSPLCQVVRVRVGYGLDLGLICGAGWCCTCACSCDCGHGCPCSDVHLCHCAAPIRASWQLARPGVTDQPWLHGNSREDQVVGLVMVVVDLRAR